MFGYIKPHQTHGTITAISILGTAVGRILTRLVIGKIGFNNITIISFFSKRLSGYVSTQHQKNVVMVLGHIVNHLALFGKLSGVIIGSLPRSSGTGLIFSSPHSAMRDQNSFTITVSTQHTIGPTHYNTLITFAIMSGARLIVSEVHYKKLQPIRLENIKVIVIAVIIA